MTLKNRSIAHEDTRPVQLQMLLGGSSGPSRAGARLGRLPAEPPQLLQHCRRDRSAPTSLGVRDVPLNPLTQGRAHRHTISLVPVSVDHNTFQSQEERETAVLGTAGRFSNRSPSARASTVTVSPSTKSPSRIRNCQGVVHTSLERPLQGSRAVGGIVSFAHELLLGRISHADVNLSFLEAFRQA